MNINVHGRWSRFPGEAPGRAAAVPGAGAPGAAADPAAEAGGTQATGAQATGAQASGAQASGSGPAPAPGSPGGPGTPRRNPGAEQPEGPPPRRLSRRKRKILAWTGSVMAALVLLTSAGAFVVYHHLAGNLHQLNLSGILGSQPASAHPQAQNIMVIGSDTRAGQARRYGNGGVISTDQSDTLMIVHVPADRKWADIMSIPRDSWVHIPSCVMGNGRQSAPTTFKINEAFAIGNLHGNRTPLGIGCTIKTLEADTGIRIDHFVAVNFAGFTAMVNAVGGVPECNSHPISDPNSKLRLTAGHHLLKGSQALAYVRARYTLGNGSDLERISRQQAFMSSLVGRARSKLYNPPAIYHFLDAATRSLTIDSGLGGLSGLYKLAMSVKGLPTSKVTFFTLPTYPRMLVDPSDQANVLWTQPAASLIFQAFRQDRPVTQAMLQGPHGASSHPVAVKVLNGTPRAGLQDTVAGLLRQKGFRLAGTGSAGTTSVTQTVIRYHAADEQAARQLAGKFRGAALQQVPGTGSPLTLLLGSDYGSTANAGSSASPQPSPDFSPRTASQNICT
jgi:LCP family protein required for cell wall assembly